MVSGECQRVSDVGEKGRAGEGHKGVFWGGSVKSNAPVSIWERQRTPFLPYTGHLHLLLIFAGPWGLFLATLI